MALKKGSSIKYTGNSVNVLKKGNIYVVESVYDGGIRVKMSTGFVGIVDGYYRDVSQIKAQAKERKSNTNKFVHNG